MKRALGLVFAMLSLTILAGWASASHVVPAFGFACAGSPEGSFTFDPPLTPVVQEGVAVWTQRDDACAGAFLNPLCGPGDTCGGAAVMRGGGSQLEAYTYLGDCRFASMTSGPGFEPGDELLILGGSLAVFHRAVDANSGHQQVLTLLLVPNEVCNESSARTLGSVYVANRD